MCLLRLRDVSLGYRGRPILEHIDLEIERGEFVALLGPNGSGKTTLLRGIVGLLPVMAGTLEYGFDRAESPLGYVPQRESLDPTFPLTVSEVVVMGTYARLSPLRRVGRRQREVTARALDLVGLGAIAGQRFASLSGGQIQRALIARALAAEPTFLVLDEPTAGVDQEATASIMARREPAQPGPRPDGAARHPSAPHAAGTGGHRLLGAGRPRRPAGGSTRSS